MNFKKGQKECAELPRCLKDDKIRYYSEWGTGGAMPGRGQMSKVVKSNFTTANKKYSLRNSIWHVSITRSRKANWAEITVCNPDLWEKPGRD